MIACGLEFQLLLQFALELPPKARVLKVGAPAFHVTGRWKNHVEIGWA